MRDDVTFVERLHRDLRDVSWPEPAELRAAARRRSRRTAVTAAAAVLAVAAGAAVLAPGAGGPKASPDAGTTGGPAVLGRAEIPAEALLTPQDVPVRTDEQLGVAGLDEPVRADQILQSCAQERGLPADPAVSRYSRSQTLIDTEENEKWFYRRAVLSQAVYRLDGDPSRVFTELERLVTACGSWTETTQVQSEREPLTARLTHHWTVARRDFAGDQAVLIHHAFSQPVDPVTGRPVGFAPVAEDTLVVRSGDLVSVLVPAPAMLPGAPGTGVTEAQFVDLARAAARRMCTAANPGC
ncbi:hypothetical protein [Micromonospora siamensis]|uniref:Uncharacterized protein n=1 Tax=Micromonospora siamensis TaxID=299152 RepID=A0A1C5HCN8_9ACTN|nr:hypothetical protein [Micromonospora siamensis]SCG43799.1 hypothetical protein GA0074704_1472 [Micromonospora siamensis]